MFKTLRAADVIVVGIIFLGITTGSADLLGIQDPIATAFIAFGVTCAVVRRLAAWRRFERPELRFSSDRVRVAVISFLAIAPWQLLLVLKDLHVAAVVAPAHFPLWLRTAGAALTLVGTIRPFWRGIEASTDSGVGVLDAAGLFLVSASPVIGLLAASELALVTSPLRFVLFFSRPETSLQ